MRWIKLTCFLFFVLSQALAAQELATTLVKGTWKPAKPSLERRVPAPDPVYIRLNTMIRAAEAEGRYADAVAERDELVGHDLQEVQPDKYELYMITTEMEDLALRLAGVGRTEDAVNVSAAALRQAEQVRNLYFLYDFLSLRLLHARVLRMFGSGEQAQAVCRAVVMRDVPRTEMRRERLDDRAVLEARKEIMCGDRTKAVAWIRAEVASHPNWFEGYLILRDDAWLVGDPVAAKKFENSRLRSDGSPHEATLTGRLFS